MWNLADTRRVLYRLPEVLAATDVFVFEGEKDVDAARGWSLTATCNPMGAGKGKWLGEYSESLRGKRVTIIADADEPGRKHAEEAAQSLRGKAASVKVIELPHAKDLSEWVDRGGTRDEFLKLIHDAPKWDPGPVEGLAEPYTELGNAERLIRKYGDMIRYNHEQKKWFIWNDRAWAIDRSGTMKRYMQDVVRGMLRQAADIETKASRAQLLKWEKTSECEHNINASINLAACRVPILVEEFNRDIEVLNLDNGTLDLRTFQFYEHRKEDLITKISPVDYDPHATCPRWESFLSEVMLDKTIIPFLQRAVGYSLTGSIVEHCLFLLHGTGRNGKSVFIKTIQYVLGDYAMQSDWSSFVVTKNGVHVRNDIARLHGARFVAAIESEQNVQIAESLIKATTGGDKIAARFLYQEHFEFVPQFKLWLATNHLPKIRGTDDAIWSRIKKIPFAVYFPEEKQDKHLEERLRVEAPGILNWAIEGLKEYRVKGLDTPEAVKAATEDYRDESDALKHFLDACCISHERAEVGSRELYTEYRTWAEQSGEFYVMSQREFTKAMEERGFRSKHAETGRRWLKLGLADVIPLKQVRGSIFESWGAEEITAVH